MWVFSISPQYLSKSGNLVHLDQEILIVFKKKLAEAFKKQDFSPQFNQLVQYFSPQNEEVIQNPMLSQLLAQKSEFLRSDFDKIVEQASVVIDEDGIVLGFNETFLIKGIQLGRLVNAFEYGTLGTEPRYFFRQIIDEMTKQIPEIWADLVFKSFI